MTPSSQSADGDNRSKGTYGGEDLETAPTQPPIPGLIVPPDGGWGWVVVFASFMIHVLADGFTYTLGIFFVEFLSYFDNVSEASASWVASILVGVTLGSGPISGYFVNKFGCRSVTIAGAILAAASLFVSAFASTIILLYITIGLGVGLGFGLMYLPAIVCVTSYFEKRRSFATGIAVCGSGIGTFAMSPFIDYLVISMGWKNALIILTGLVLNCVVFGALFRPLEDNNTLENTPENTLKNTPTEDIPTIQISGDVKRIQSDANLLPSRLNQDEFQRINSQGNLKNVKNNEINRMAVSQPLLQADPNEIPLNFDMRDLQNANYKGRNSLPSSRSGSGLLYRKDILYRGSLLNIPEYKQNPVSYRSSIVRLDLALKKEQSEDEEDGKQKCLCVPKETLKDFLNLELFGNGIFILFSLSNFCTSIGFNAPYIFMKHRAEQQGISPSNASFLLSVVGIANTVSRILLGYISDHPKVNRLYLYNLSLTICGIATCLSIWMSDYASSCFYASVFGATSGAYVGLTSVVLVDLLGMENLTVAFGWLLLFQGIASLIGPPLCGSLYDLTNSYDGTFLLAGSMIAISGLILFFIPCIWKQQAKNIAKKTSTSSQIH